MPAAERSDKSPVENEKHIFVLGKIRKGDVNSSNVFQCKIRRRGIDMDFFHERVSLEGLFLVFL